MSLQSAGNVAPSYANAASGALYRGVVSTTPTPSFSSPTPAPAPRRQDDPPVVRSTVLPLSMGAGIFLFVAGGAISGYDWLRSRRLPAPAHAALENDELENDELENDELDAEQER
jgi:hypothetical protein